MQANFRMGKVFQKYLLLEVFEVAFQLRRDKCFELLWRTSKKARLYLLSNNRLLLKKLLDYGKCKPVDAVKAFDDIKIFREGL